jgi:hypothetical protein
MLNEECFVERCFQLSYWPQIISRWTTSILISLMSSNRAIIHEFGWPLEKGFVTQANRIRIVLLTELNFCLLNFTGYFFHPVISGFVRNLYSFPFQIFLGDFRFFFFFCDRYFRDRVLQTICPGWLQTAILLISTSWVAGITGMTLELYRSPFFRLNGFFFLYWFCIWPFH